MTKSTLEGELQKCYHSNTCDVYSLNKSLDIEVSEDRQGVWAKYQAPNGQIFKGFGLLEYRAKEALAANMAEEYRLFQSEDNNNILSSENRPRFDALLEVIEVAYKQKTERVLN